MGPDADKTEQLWMAPDLSLDTLSDLAAAAAPVEPPADLWGRIERRLDDDLVAEQRSFAPTPLTARR